MVAAFPGLGGRLLSSSFALDLLPTVAGYETIPGAQAKVMEGICGAAAAALGPASSVRAVADTVVIPLIVTLGFSIGGRDDGPQRCILRLTPKDDDRRAPFGSTVAIVVGLNQPLSSVWRESVRTAAAAGGGWVFCSNGEVLRLVDSRRSWSRDYVEFNIAVLGENHSTQSALWSLARASALLSPSPLLDRAVALSARHGVEVCRALGDGVVKALQTVLDALAPRASRHYTLDVLFEQSLTVLYRILFLLFAEARGLVPLWHPIYRDRYSVDTIVSSLLAGKRYGGLWQVLQAISRLAHAGCSVGELSVTAFNGRLFSPIHAAAFDRGRIGDAVLAEAILAIGTTRIGSSRARIAYRDLDVEQLGAVYERVLDYQPQSRPTTVELVRGGDARKTTGTFYTPRAVTSYLVRQTLDPLVSGRSAEAIFNLRILDPAMGSGAFLVAACRYLAAAVEQALVRDGHWHTHDITPTDRALLRRQVAARCLFGVDLNPMAVQLARLSLWLAGLAVNKPLSFLDHHLLAGDSLIGAHPDDLRRQPSASARRVTRPGPMPLFDSSGLSTSLSAGVRVRNRLVAEADDSAADVRRKELALAALNAPGSELGRWSRALDLWCAGWFSGGDAPDRQLFGELLTRVLEGRCQLPDRVTAPLLDRTDSVAARHRFLHWPLAFPEVFCDSNGGPLPDGGFDAVLSNPPWDMVRGDAGEDESRTARRAAARQLTDFVRESGVYTVTTKAHANRYQLFVERAMQLARPGGRIGLVVPAGLASDAGAAPLRRFLFDHAEVDGITGLDNREAIFPIHRSVRFVLLTCTTGSPTSSVRCRFGISRPDTLEQDSEARGSLTLTRSFLARLSGSDDLGIPELSCDTDLRILERISAAFPPLGSADGWDVQFGRELNASDDRRHFESYAPASASRPVLEGKQIEPFRVAVERTRHQLKIGAPDRVPRRARLAYRDVASATNRLTLIAAIIPPRAVTTHTLFCLKTAISMEAQQVLCGLLNSYVANYLVRFRVNTHVTASLISRLFVPRLEPSDPGFSYVLSLVRELLKARHPVEEMDEHAELQAVVARLYRLSASDFEHVLSTFPLVPAATKHRARRRFDDVHSLY